MSGRFRHALPNTNEFSLGVYIWHYICRLLVFKAKCGARVQATKDMLVELKAAYSVSILLQLKLYIRTAYRLDGERIAQFSPFGAFPFAHVQCLIKHN